MKNPRKNTGFSIIEIILYIGILWIILTVITNFSLTALEERGQQKSKQAVNQDVDFILDKISYEVENAIKINRTESIWGKLVLNQKNDKVSIFTLSWGSVYYQETSQTGSTEPERISGKNTEISDLKFLLNERVNQVKVELQAKSNAPNLSTSDETKFQTTVVSKNSDQDNDGCPDIVDQYPNRADCCKDTDGDEICDKLDNCPLIHNSETQDWDGDGDGRLCDGPIDNTHNWDDDDDDDDDNDDDNNDDGNGNNGWGWSCIQGKKLAIWIDRNNDGNVDQDDSYLGNITAYSGDKTTSENYNYFSYSAHPIQWPEPDAYEGQVFFYEGADGLSFNFFYNVDSDDGSEGSADNEVDWWVKTSGNALRDDVMLSDDNHELSEYFVNEENAEKSYRGKFHYWYNTDWGAIGPFQGEDFKIHVSVENSGDLTNAAFYSADDKVVSLIDEGEISSFIITYEEYEDCTNENNTGTGSDTGNGDTGTGSDTGNGDTGTGSDTGNGDTGTGSDTGNGWDWDEIDYCALEGIDGTWDANIDTIIGGTWKGVGSVDSCIYSCNYHHAFWQEICKMFECFYTGNQNNFETNIDNNEYAGVWQIFSMDSESMYWKKVFKLNFADEAIAKLGRFKFSLNYCHGGSRLSTWWLRGRCYGNGNHLNGIFDGDQTVEMFNYVKNSWDQIHKLKTYPRNNNEVYVEFEHSKGLRNYINSNKEVTARIKFKSKGASWGHRQRWYFLAPARYLFIDYFLLETHVQALDVCGDWVKEMDEQCDDGSHCSDGTECTNFGDCKCVGIGDEKCKPRSYIGNNCNAECLNENAVCGNGLIEENEECDDGNVENGDGCDFTCEVETCGNKIIEWSEECDTGTRCDLNGSFCEVNAECEGIGDEQCRMRDGDDDRCSQFCLNEICGNNRQEASEECDDGNLIDGDGCNSICRIEECWNGIQDLGEECDDGNLFDDDNCNNTCESQVCWDGLKNRLVEECDNGKQCGDAEATPCQEDSECIGLGDGLCRTRSGDWCDVNCLIEIPVCGNGKIEQGEECDDSNLNDGDSCSHTCMHEYSAEYDFTNDDHKAYLVFGTQKPHKKSLNSFADFEPQHNYPASVAYQVELNQLDEILEQTLGTSYQKIKEIDGLKFIAEALTPRFSFFNFINFIPKANASYGFISPEGNKYLNHKFSYKIQENEYNIDEDYPKRIEYIQFTWEGTVQSTTYNQSRYARLYVWKNNQWKIIDTQKWDKHNVENTNKTLTFKINNDIESYLDSDHKIHFMVETNKKWYNLLATDFANLEVRAYGYRDALE